MVELRSMSHPRVVMVSAGRTPDRFVVISPSSVNPTASMDTLPSGVCVVVNRSRSEPCSTVMVMGRWGSSVTVLLGFGG